MQLLRKILDSQAKLFEKGGKLEKLYAVYEMHDTILFTPGEVTQGKTHVRDALDLKRMMITVVAALIPAVLWAIYNTGYQARLAIAKGATALDTWREGIFEALGFVHLTAATALEGTPLGAEGAIEAVGSDFLGNSIYGLLWFLPIFATVFIMGGIVEVLFAVTRNHEVNEGFLVTGFLFPLTLPPTMPLWQVALGIAFGVIIGKEVFGGTGMNILNPALTGRAFLFFAYPAAISGDKPWVAATMADGQSGATLLGRAAADSTALEGHGVGSDMWMDAFLGDQIGSMGEVSTIACLLGAGILVATQIGSWRTMAGVVLGTVATSILLNAVGSDTNPMFSVPFYWHMVLGGWAFGMVFMATDPVSSAFTETGKLIYGAGIGILVVLVRVVNPAYPEGMMLAILFMNMFAPLIDHFFVQANVKRRAARHGA
jgi:Na+-transporting NADH:ubiquinone oxidoreductase subunit B